MGQFLTKGAKNVKATNGREGDAIDGHSAGPNAIHRPCYNASRFFVALLAFAPFVRKL
jgi:hypothetical protein